MTNTEESAVTAPAVAKPLTMAQARACERSLFIRNDTGGLWTLHDKSGTGRVDYELKPHGTPGSIAYLPPHALDVPGIARNISKGTITVSDELEPEMMELDRIGHNVSRGLLDQFQVQVQTSPQSRAIDVRDRFTELEANGRPGGIRTQGQQRASTVDEFNDPQPFKTEEGRWFDPKTATFIDSPTGVAATPGSAGVDPQSTGITSVTVTRPARLPEGQ